MKREGSFDRNSAELMGQLHLLARRFIHQYREAADGTLTRLETAVIEALEGRRDFTMGALADAVSLTFSGLTAVVDKLVTKKLVERGRSDEDRRIVWVRLTAAGRKVRSERGRRRMRMARAMLGSLSVDEQENFLGLMKKIGRSVTSGERAARPAAKVRLT